MRRGVSFVYCHGSKATLCGQCGGVNNAQLPRTDALRGLEPPNLGENDAKLRGDAGVQIDGGLQTVLVINQANHGFEPIKTFTRFLVAFLRGHREHCTGPGLCGDPVVGRLVRGGQAGEGLR